MRSWTYFGQFLRVSYLLLCLVCFHLLIYILKEFCIKNILNKPKYENVEEEYFWGYAQISCLFFGMPDVPCIFLCMCGQKREKDTSDIPHKYLKLKF